MLLTFGIALLAIGAILSIQTKNETITQYSNYTVGTFTGTVGIPTQTTVYPYLIIGAPLAIIGVILCISSFLIKERKL
jgi:hypothetical protein